MSITVEFYDSFKPIYKDKNYLGSNKAVIEDVELNTKLNKEQYEYNNYNEFKNDLLTNNNNIKKYLRNNKYYVKITFHDETYEGQINEKGNYEGIGKDVVINEEGGKSTYIGEWEKNKQDGYGVFTWSNGSKYEGEWKENKQDGKGKMFYSNNGATYEGDFKEDLRDGYGVYTWKNGEKYEGDFKEDLQDGKGVFTFPDGDRYEGEYEGGKRNGKGKIFYSNTGATYEGDFYNGKQLQGKGKITWKDGSTYEGFFNNYGKSSTGTLTINSLQQQWNFPMSNIDIDCKPPKKICKIPFTERTNLMKNLPSEWGCCNYYCVEETREPEKEFNINY